MQYDDEHHAVVEKLLESIGLSSVAASEHDDINSIADRYILDNGNRLPVGLKRRGANSQDDFNLSAWSASKGDLPEFANAGGKLYFYWMKDGHRLVRFRDQSILDELHPRSFYPHQFSPLQPRDGNWKWTVPNISGVRRSSAGSNTHQGVIFVPNNDRYVEPVGTWSNFTF